MAMQHCIHCQRNVMPAKQFNRLVFIFLYGIFYMPFYLMKKKTSPICDGVRWFPSLGQDKCCIKSGYLLALPLDIRIE